MDAPLDANPVRHHDEEDLARAAREAIESSATAWQTAREEAQEDFEFRKGDQWPQGLQAQREADNRPIVTVNKIDHTISLIVGEWLQNRSSIKVRPVDDNSDPEKAEIREGLIRAIEHDSTAEVAYRTALNCAVTGGFGFFRVSSEYTEDETWDQELRIRPIHNPFSVYIDPMSYGHDLGDARFVAVTDWLPREEFRERWPDAGIGEIDGYQGDYEFVSWWNQADDQVRVAEYWWREPHEKLIAYVADPFKQSEPRTLDLTDMEPERLEVMRNLGLILRERKAKATKIRKVLVSGSEVLEGPIDWPASYFPIVPVYGHDLVLNGERYLYGLVRFAKDPQRLYNYWRSCLTELYALQPKVPFIGPTGFAENEHKALWDASHKASIPYLYYDGDTAPKREPPPQPSTAMVNEAAQATQDIKEAQGIFDAMKGKESNETSGRAILARQQQGSQTTAIFQTSLRLAIQHAGRIINELLPIYYDNARVVRILGDDADDMQLVGINGARVADDEGAMQETVDLLTGKYDVWTTAGPSHATRRLEQQEFFLEVLKIVPQQMAPVVAVELLKSSDMPGAAEVTERIEEMLGLGTQLSPEVAEQVQQLVLGTVEQALSRLSQPGGGQPQLPVG